MARTRTEGKLILEAAMNLMSTKAISRSSKLQKHSLSLVEDHARTQRRRERDAEMNAADPANRSGRVGRQLIRFIIQLKNTESFQKEPSQRTARRRQGAKDEDKQLERPNVAAMTMVCVKYECELELAAEATNGDH